MHNEIPNSLARGIEGKRDKPVEIIDLIEISRGGDIYIDMYRQIV